MTAVSPFSTLPSSFITRSAKRSCKEVNSASTSSSLTAASSFLISKFLYAPSFTSGFTVTVNLKVTLSSSILSMPKEGRETTHKSCSLIPSLKASPATSSIASINIFCVLICFLTSASGACPLRKPGRFTFLESLPNAFF